MIEFEISAPGKIILFGEHSVVYGKKAVACAINKLVKVKISPANVEDAIELKFSDLWNGSLLIPLSDLRFHEDTDLKEFCENAVKAYSPVFRSTNIDLCLTAVSAFLYGYLNVFEEPIALNVSITSGIPIGAGLGSSAAFNSALACAFLFIAGDVSQDLIKRGTREKINSLAFKMETIVHNSPSGIDNSVAVLGGALSFQNGNITHFVVPQLRLLIVDTCVSRSTKTLVQGVKGKQNMFSGVFNLLFDSMHAIAAEAEELLRNFNQDDETKVYEKLGILFNTNQGVLNAIGVGHAAINTICTCCEKFNFSCKLTGAGGGGCVLVLIPPNKWNEMHLLEQELQVHKFKSFEVELGATGVAFVS